MDSPKSSRLLRILLVLATIFTGFMAGGNFDRYFVQVPGFRHVEILCWAQYSQYADLGNGIFLYPIQAMGGFLLLLASAVIIMRNKSAYKAISLPVYAATIFFASGLILTLFAAPIMLGLPKLGNDPRLLQQAFDQFHFYGFYRGVVQMLGFVCCAWGLGRMGKI